MKSLITVCLLVSTLITTGCFIGTVGTTIKINDNCTAEVRYDNEKAYLDIIRCNNE
jgi:hypothetical protein